MKFTRPMPGFYAHLLIVLLLIYFSFIASDPHISHTAAQWAGLWLFMTLVGYVFDSGVKSAWIKKARRYRSELKRLTKENDRLQQEKAIYQEELWKIDKTISVITKD